ncbi:YcgL domain-containing protein [Faucicola boevrei]|uniref:YcgL domain-containing protein n=1 Tax=Faucicola boevrei TaxID=346665 RepID=UPI000364CD3C|nr:YcgL domain-containing protein [Moraxella boevrei]
MHVDIYKFSKKDDLYVYIARPNYPDDVDDIKDWLAVLPKDFRQALGKESFVMHLDLVTTKKLARVDKAEVLEKLQNQGYFVQMPAEEEWERQARLKMAEAQQNKWQ